MLPHLPRRPTTPIRHRRETSGTRSGMTRKRLLASRSVSCWHSGKSRNQTSGFQKSGYGIGHSADLPNSISEWPRSCRLRESHRKPASISWCPPCVPATERLAPPPPRFPVRPQRNGGPREPTRTLRGREHHKCKRDAGKCGGGSSEMQEEADPPERKEPSTEHQRVGAKVSRQQGTGGSTHSCAGKALPRNVISPT
jgi:hypothetical protein